MGITKTYYLVKNRYKRQASTINMEEFKALDKGPTVINIYDNLLNRYPDFIIALYQRRINNGTKAHSDNGIFTNVELDNGMTLLIPDDNSRNKIMEIISFNIDRLTLNDRGKYTIGFNHLRPKDDVELLCDLDGFSLSIFTMFRSLVLQPSFDNYTISLILFDLEAKLKSYINLRLILCREFDISYLLLSKYAINKYSNRINYSQDIKDAICKKESDFVKSLILKNVKHWTIRYYNNNEDVGYYLSSFGKLEDMIWLKEIMPYPDLVDGSRLYGSYASPRSTYRFGSVIIDNAFVNCIDAHIEDLSFKLRTSL